MFRVFSTVSALCPQCGPKVRFSAGSAWYVRRTLVYVRNTFRAYKRTNSSRLQPLQQSMSTVLHQKKWRNIRAVIVASRRQRQPAQYAGAVWISPVAKYAPICMLRSTALHAWRRRRLGVWM